MAKSVTIQIDDDIHRWLTFVAASQEVPVDAFVCECLREARARSVNSAAPRRFGTWLSRSLLMGGIALLVIGLALAVAGLVFLR